MCPRTCAVWPNGARRAEACPGRTPTMPRPMHPVLNKPLKHSTLEKIGILFGRALLLRCPACGQSGLFAGMYKLKETCPGCGLLLQREGDGYELGSMVVNLMV